MEKDPSRFTVVTANTHYSDAISTLEDVQDFAGTDVLMLQEVLNIDRAKVEENLGYIGLKIAAYDEEAGLAVAVSDKFKVKGSESYQVQARSKLADKAEAMGFNPRLRKRSLLVAQLEDQDGNSLAVATGHPIVYVRFLQRMRQVNAMSKVLTDKYPLGNLIFGADKNHYPGPNRVDRLLAQASNLVEVSVKAPTVLLSETKHKYLRHFGIKDARLDVLLTRGVSEVSSQILKIKSDHRAIRAILKIKD